MASQIGVPMELHCQIERGLKPKRAQRLFASKADPRVLRASICLLNDGGKREVPARDVARVFTALVDKLAGGRTITLVFGDHPARVRRVLGALGIQAAIVGGSLWIDLSPVELALLVRVLEKVTLATFCAAVNGQEIRRESDILRSLDRIYFAVIFEMYDDSMELLSKFVPAELVLNAVREVGAEEGIRVCC